MSSVHTTLCMYVSFFGNSIDHVYNFVECQETILINIFCIILVGTRLAYFFDLGRLFFYFSTSSHELAQIILAHFSFSYTNCLILPYLRMSNLRKPLHSLTLAINCVSLSQIKAFDPMSTLICHNFTKVTIFTGS